MAQEHNVEVEVTEVKLQYTFMGWDRRILPLFADGRGKEFPALLTKRAGIDISLLDWMRPLYDHGICPNGLSSILLEFHTKRFTRSNIKYERYIAKMKRLDPSCVHPLFGEFANKQKYNGSVPTGKYLGHIYKIHHAEIEDHLAKEVKKRGADILYIAIWRTNFQGTCIRDE